MKRTHWILAGAVALASLGAQARDCDKARNQLELNDCAADRWAAVDRELNQVYADYRKRLDASEARQLKQVQVAWIKFRDASCLFESSGVKGGSAYTMVHQGCLATRTEARVKELKALASCEEGDLSCPAPR